MSIVNVSQTEKGKWVVLHNYLQIGIDYKDKELANQEAIKVAKEFRAKRVILA